MAEDPKKLTRAHKIALGIISAACCCLIGVSAFALVAPDALNQGNQGEATQQADSASTDYGNEIPQEGQSGEAADQDGNTQDESDGAPGNQGKSAEKEGGTASSSSNKASSPGSSSSSGKQNSNGNSQGTAANPTASSTVTVSVSVSSSAADGRVSGSAHPTFKKGATAYDALCATGLSVSTKSSQYGIYVSAIGGLAEFEYGGKSGWMYSVNGSAPNVSCGKYVLKDGDSVSWYYVK